MPIYTHELYQTYGKGREKEMASLPVQLQKLRDIVSDIVPDSTLKSVSKLPAPALQRRYKLAMTDGSSYTLCLPPLMSVRLLRHELKLLPGEAALVTFINASMNRSESRRPSTASEAPTPATPTDSASTPGTYDGEEVSPLSVILPTVIKHTPNSREIGSPYTIFAPPSQQQGELIGSHKILVLQLAAITSPTRTFGPAHKVLSHTPFAPSSFTSSTRSTPISSPRVSGPMSPPSGPLSPASVMSPPSRHATLSPPPLTRAISSPLSSSSPRTISSPYTIDAISVSSPRPTSRPATPGYGYRYTSPRPQTPSLYSTGAPPVRLPSGHLTWTSAFGAMLEAVLRDGEDMSVLLPYEDIRRHVERLEPLLHRIRTPRLFLAYLSIEDGGEVDWAGGVFGDPLMSSWFDGKDEEGNGGLEDFDTVLDDPENAPSRMLLYRAYHTLVMIVMEYYRPTRESSRKELVWRKRLTGILGELEKVEVEGRGTEEPATPKRSSEVAGVGGGETPGKRVKTEEEKRIGEDVRSERESHSHGDKEDGSGDGEAESESDDESDEDYIPPFEDPTPPPG